MSHPDLCYRCVNLKRHEKETNIIRKSDGQKERAVWYSCKALGLPLSTISRHNPPYCRWYVDEGRCKR